MQLSQYINNFYTSLQNRIQPLGTKVLATFGLFLAIKYSFRQLSSLYRNFFSGGHDIVRRYGRGSWVVITGATAGIGFAFAVELASLGFNIVLLGRNETALEERAQELKTRFGPGLQVKTMQADLVHSGEDGFFEYISQELSDLDVSILINNAGIGSMLGPFHEDQDLPMLNTILVNDLAPVLMTKRLLPKLLQREGRSAVITIGSIASLRPYSGMCIYSSSKAFVDLFSRELQMQYGDKIDFLTCRYSTIMTKLNAYMKKSYSITTEEAVKATLWKLGAVPYTCGHWKHEIFGCLIQNPFVGRLAMGKLINDIVVHVHNIMASSARDVA